MSGQMAGIASGYVPSNAHDIFCGKRCISISHPQTAALPKLGYASQHGQCLLHDLTRITIQLV